MKNIVRFLAAALLAGCAAAPPPEVLRPTPAGQRSLAVLMSYFPGTFDSINQEKGPGAGTRMRIAEFWTARQQQGEFWMYVEHAKVGQDDKPFSQRIYRFVETAGRFLADVYVLPGNPESFVGEWRKPEPFAAFQPDQLKRHEGCRLKVGQMTVMFWAGTEGKSCRAQYPAAAYETTSILANSSGMKEGTQGFDKAGRQVAGEAGVWEFRRMSREPR